MKLHRILGLLPLLLATSSPVRAQSGSWAVDAAGNWGNPLNWIGGTIATGIDATAYFTNGIAASRTVTVDASTTPLDLGFIRYGTNSGATNWTVTGGTINLTVSSGLPELFAANNTPNLSSTLAGSQGFAKSGGGTVRLTAANNIGGPVVVGAGGLTLANVGALRGVTSIVVSNGATLLTEPAGTYQAAPVTITGAGFGRGALYFQSGTYTWTNAVTLNGNSSIGSYSPNSTVNLRAPIDGTGSLTLWAGGGGITHVQRHELFATNTFAGDTTLDATFGANGIWGWNGSELLPTNRSLTMNINWSTNYGAVDLKGWTQTLSTISFNGAQTKIVRSSVTAPGYLMITNSFDLSGGLTLLSNVTVSAGISAAGEHVFVDGGSVLTMIRSGLTGSYVRIGGGGGNTGTVYMTSSTIRATAEVMPGAPGSVVGGSIYLAATSLVSAFQIRMVDGLGTGTIVADNSTLQFDQIGRSGNATNNYGFIYLNNGRLQAAATASAGWMTMTQMIVYVRNRGGILDVASNKSVNVGLPVRADGASTGGVTKTGLGMLVYSALDATNASYTGGTRILGGSILALGDGCFGVVPGAPDAANITLDDGGIKNNGRSLVFEANRGITLGAGGGTFTAGWAPTNPIVVNGPITGVGTLRINLDGSPIILSNAANDFAGGVVVGVSTVGVYTAGSAAWLRLGASEVIPHGAGKGDVTLVSTNKGVLDLNAQYETINGLWSDDGGALVANYATAPATLVVGENNASGVFNGRIASGSTNIITVIKTGTGTQELGGSGDNTYMALTVLGGTVILNKSTNAARAVGSGLSLLAGTLQLGATGGGDQIWQSVSPSLAGGTFDFNGRNEGFAALTGPGSSVLNDLAGSASTVTVGQTDASGAFAGLLRDGAGTLAFSKVGSGTQTLLTAATYSGPSEILAGRVITMGLFGPGVVSIATGATLTANGNLGGDVLCEGTFDIGDGAHAVSSGAFILFPTATLNVQLGGTVAGGQYDVLTASAGALDGQLAVTNFGGFVPAPGNQFTVLRSSSLTGTFATTNLPTLPVGDWLVTYTSTSVVLSVSGGSSSPYDLWAATNGIGAGQELADADGDGYLNLLEYAAGSNPTNNGSGAALASSRAGGILKLTFGRNTNAVDVTYFAEASYAATNGADWVTIATNTAGVWSGPAAVAESGVGSPVSVTVDDTVSGATNRFLRLRITRP